jgi:Rubredoxin
MAPADIALAALNVCGGALALIILAPFALLLPHLIRHRRVHRQLGIPPGSGWRDLPETSTCPICIADREFRDLPWHVRYSRNLKRRALRKKEFKID